MASKRTTSTRTRKSAAKRAGSKRSPAKRDTVKAQNATFYAKRAARGQFKDMDEKGRSLKADRRTKAKTRTKSGYGDRGDRAA